MGLDSNPKPAGSGFELRYGPRPKPEDCQPDEAVSWNSSDAIINWKGTQKKILIIKLRK